MQAPVMGHAGGQAAESIVDGLMFLAGLAVSGLVATVVILWVVPLLVVAAIAVSGADARSGRSHAAR
jgi:hypothetical protein